ncbi:MAG: EamA family transporter [Rhizobiales bacterium]|nr:EamA family transporter [Hyphomicrobiales bacterium]
MPDDLRPQIDLTAEAPPVLPAPTAAPTASYVRLGYVFAAVGAIVFSTKAVAIKLAYQEAVDAETLLALRMILSLPFYFVIGGWSLRERLATGRGLPTGKLVLAAIGTGLLGYWVASYLDFLGLEYITAQIERMILFTYPIFVVIFGTMFFGQPITRRIVVAIAISYSGLAVIFGHNIVEGGENAVIGGLLVLGCAIAFALYQLFAKDLITVVGPRLFTCIAMTGAAAGAILQFLVTHPASALMVSTRVWLISIFLAVGSTVLPSFFLNAALQRISAQANATIGTLSPVATILLAWAILGETMTPIAWLGTALVMVGVGWFTLGGRK